MDHYRWRRRVTTGGLSCLGMAILLQGASGQSEASFEPAQPELFAEPGAVSIAWGDFDNDGDLDVFVGMMRGQPNRLYRNDDGTFVDVAVEVGVADSEEGRGAAWGDFDADGDLDIYVTILRGTVPNRLYRNDGDGKRFTDVALDAGVALSSDAGDPPLTLYWGGRWVDFDNDGDLDLYVTNRNGPNPLFRNDGGKFTEIEVGVGDPRKTIGTTWFDYDLDGDLDLFTGNQNGDTNGAYRNDDGLFVDVARELGLEQAGREPTIGTVSVATIDYDRDGDLDVFYANYGPNQLFRNDGDGRFVDVAPELGIAGDFHSVGVTWGDYDNDGWPDLYVTNYLRNVLNYRDYLFRNVGGEFTDVTPANVLENDGDHSVQWADFDRDGDLDLHLASNHPEGTHYLFRNRMAPEAARRSLQVAVVDNTSSHTRAGSEVRVFAQGTSRLLGTRVVDTGTGYNSQNAMPVHFGLPDGEPVDVELTAMTPGGRRVTLIPNVDPAEYRGRWLTIKVEPSTGQVVR